MRWHRLALLLALAGCTGDPSCTIRVGCASRLVVQLPPGATAGSACVAGVCTSEVVGGELRVPLGRRADGDTALVTVTLPGAPAYEGEVALTRTRPNGETCPPVCVNGTARLDLASGQVVTVDAGAPAPS